MRLIIVATDMEAAAIPTGSGDRIVVSGIGRTNAACATTESLLAESAVEAVISVGIAGALPGSDLKPGDVLVASACIYAEEGLITPDGFCDLESMGFALGDFSGNTVPVDRALLEQFGDAFPIGPIATVATASGTDAAAATVAERTGAMAEAMEGAAVVHAARRRRVPAIEVRVISNLTGHRPSQAWDMPAALAALRTTAQTLAGIR
ncbi:MAG: futalosine hydrolase [Phycisphaerales bacterium]|nr:futalosine hydrolase [Phycisphaerae bacterium]NNF43818.1 futalosine hydrolase [Phycisphaerales bacterium]NNM27196.1 futalosine hydrolase [Phycisphaerales bacterium]